MAVSLDAVGPSASGVAGATSPLTWTHTPAGTPSAILVGVTSFTGGSSLVSGVTYGGVAMASLGYQAANNSTSGGIEVWYLGSGIPTGARTVQVTFTGGQDTLAGSLSYTGSASAGGPGFGSAAGTACETVINGSTTGGMITCFACFGGGSGGQTFAGEYSVTVRCQENGSTGSGADNLAIGTVPSNGTNQSAGFTTSGAGDWWGLIAIELLPATGVSVQVSPGTAAGTAAAPFTAGASASLNLLSGSPVTGPGAALQGHTSTAGATAQAGLPLADMNGNAATVSTALGSVTAQAGLPLADMNGNAATASGRAAGLAAAGAAALRPARTGVTAGAGLALAALESGPASSISASGIAFYPGRPPNALGFKCELNLHGTWTDITQYVMLRNDVQISNMGRADEASSITACQLTLTLNNRDARFTPKNSGSPYYPYIVRNTQLRVSVNAVSQTLVAYTGYRFCGEVSSWPPGNDVSQHDLYVSITASGIWRRIAQSRENIGGAYSRYVNLLTGLAVPAAWWAMEDGAKSPEFVLTGGSGTNLGFSGQPSFAADGISFGGSSALPQLNAARYAANVSAGPSPVANVIRFALSVPAAGDSTGTGYDSSGGCELLKVLSGGTAGKVNVSLVSSQLMIQGWTADGGSLLFSGTVAAKVNGTPVLVSAEITPSGGSIAWALRLIKPGSQAVLDQVSGSYGGASIAAVTQVQLNDQGRLTDTVAGQLGVWYSVPSLADAATALGGHAGEYAVDRFTRICAESGIATEVIGSASAPMGPQADGTLSAILQEIEDTDGGLLFETRDQLGLGYRTLGSMKDQSPAVTVGYGSGALGAPMEPTYDDALTVNSWTVTNWTGVAYQAQLTSGALSVQPPPNGVGSAYARSKTINASSDAQASAIATQLLYQGCVDDLRFPLIEFNFLRSLAAPYFASVPALRIGDYLQVTSMPAFLGGGALKQLAVGYSERIGGNPLKWAISYNTVPEAPFESGFSPGVWSVTRAVSGSVASGSQVGSTVSGSQLGPGSVPDSALSGTISARTLGGITQFVGPATPYDWSFAVTGSPSGNGYFTCTEDQARPIAIGDTFTLSSGRGGPFTVTSVDPPSGGLVNVRFTPDATSPVSSGTVYGGKNGDTWVNSSGGNQVNIWSNGTWVNVQFGPQALSFTAGGTTVTVAATPPSSPVTGDIWYDTSSGNAMKVWGGSAWVLYQWNTGAIASGAVTGAQLAGSVTARSLGGITTTTAATAPSSPVAGDIWINSSNGYQMARYSGTAWVPVTWSAGSVLSAATITGSLIAASTISAGNIAAGTITATQIASGTITGSLIAGTTITASNIASGTITASQISATAGITANQIAAGTITSSQIAAGTILASNIAAGTITASQIQAGTITAALLAAGIVKAGIIDGTTITSVGAGLDYASYDGAPAANNLAMSFAQAAGTDSHGNDYLPGFSIYFKGSSNWYAVNMAPHTDQWGVDDGARIGWFVTSGLTESSWTQTIDLYSDASTYGLLVDDSVTGWRVQHSYRSAPTSDLSVTSTSTATITNFSLPVVAGVKYYFRAAIHFSSSSSAGSASFRVSGGTSMTDLDYSFQSFLGTAASVVYSDVVTQDADLTTQSWSATNVNGIAIIEGKFQPSAGGTFLINARCTSSNAQTYTIHGGSIFNLVPGCYY